MAADTTHGMFHVQLGASGKDWGGHHLLGVAIRAEIFPSL